MKCVKCHQEMDQELQFCPYCGRAVDSKWAFTSQLLSKLDKSVLKLKAIRFGEYLREKICLIYNFTVFNNLKAHSAV